MATHHQIVTLARTLVEVSRDEYLVAACAGVRQFLPHDDVLWLDTNFAIQQFAVWRASVTGRDLDVEQTMPHLGDHPAILSYIRRPDDLLPRRLVDVPDDICPGAREARWLSQRSMGQHQLSAIVDVRPGGRGRGWVAIRERRRFSDREVDVMAALLPILVVLDRYHRPDVLEAVPDAVPGEVPVEVSGDGTPVMNDRADVGPTAAADSTVADRWVTLTTRERQVVDLMVAGLTARATGTALGIAERTVHKHLEHAYSKLGQHDRLAVARDLTERNLRAAAR